MNVTLKFFVLSGFTALALSGCTRPSQPILTRVTPSSSLIVWENWVYPGAIAKANVTGSQIEASRADAHTIIGPTTAKIYETSDAFAKVWTFYAGKAGYNLQNGRESVWSDSNPHLVGSAPGIKASLTGTAMLNGDGRGIQSSTFLYDTDGYLLVVTLTHGSAQPTTHVVLVAGYR